MFSSGNVKGASDRDVSGFEALCAALGGSVLGSLSLGKCGLGPAALAVLAAALVRVPSLTALDLSKNPVEREAAAALALQEGSPGLLVIAC